MTRCQALRPGSRASKLSRPPNCAARLGDGNLDSRAAPSVSAGLEPRRPAADHQRPARRVAAQDFRVPAAAPFLAGRRVLRAADRHAVMPAGDADVAADAFADLVARGPRAILRGRNGSAIDGRAAPMKSRMPRRTCDTMVSGEVKRPTPTTGLLVDPLDEVDHRLMACLRREAGGARNRSGSCPSSRRTDRGRPRAARLPHAPRSRHACPGRLAQLLEADPERHARRRPPVASRVTSIISRTSRTRLAIEPPYSSLRRLYSASRNCMRQIAHAGIDIDDVEPRRLGPPRRRGLPAEEVARCRSDPSPWGAVAT